MWMTKLDWFNNCFVQEAEQYVEIQESSLQHFLVRDDDPEHPQDLGLDNTNIHTDNLPKNTNSLLQPLAHGTVMAFRSYYTPCAFYSILDASEKTCVSVSECWKSYRVTDHTVNVTESMDKVSTAQNGCWKLWLEQLMTHREPQAAGRNKDYPCVSL
jgi:hypothetical protein